jgi:hypothetical protein
MARQRLRASLVLSLGIGLLCGSLTACGGEKTPETPAESASAPAPDPLLGYPLLVNGEEVSLDEIKRTAVFVCPMGQALFELAKIQVYIDQEIARQIAEDGKTAADFEVSEEIFQTELARHRAGVAAQFEGQEDVSLDTFAPTEDPVWIGNMKQTILFKEVFLPENPHEFPPVTVAAFSQNTQDGQNLWTVLCDDYDNAQASGDDPVAQSTNAAQRMFELMQTQTLINFLKAGAVIREVEADIPVHLLAIVDDTEIAVDAIWDVLVEHDKIGPMDVERARQWLLNTTLLRQGLEKEGHLLTVAAAAELYESQTGKYKDGGFSYEALALSIKRYPTIGMYKAHHRLYESLRNMLADEMTDEVLEQQGVDRTAMILSLATADADVILLSAFDFRTKTWKKNGWEDAERRAREVAQKLAAGEDWDELLDEYSDFYDLPVPSDRPEVKENDPKRKNKGRFRGKSRNPFANALDEPEFQEFLALNSITDTLFFEMEIGQIENPIKGPHGYYIPKLLQRGAATRHISPREGDKARTFLSQDYLTCRMREYCRDLMSKATISGM